MKKVLFYLPACLVVGVLAYFLYAFRGSIPDSWPILLAQLGVVAVFLASAVMLDKGLWYGCIPEIGLGAWFVYCGVNNQSPIIDETLIGIALIAYYVICGIVVWRGKGLR